LRMLKSYSKASLIRSLVEDLNDLTDNYDNHSNRMGINDDLQHMLDNFFF